MKKVLAVILAITLAFSMVLVFTACGGKKDATTTAAEKTTEAETVAEATTAAENAPKAGETLQFSTMRDRKSTL